VAAWARDALLVYRQSEGGGTELLAFAGPGKATVLTPLGELVALGPDGSRALVSDYASSPPVAKLLEVGSWIELSAIDLFAVGALGEAPRYLSYGGSWAGDRIAAEAGPGIAILGASGDKLTIERVLTFPEDAFPMPIHEPQFVDPSGGRFVAWAPVPYGKEEDPDRGYSYLECDLDSNSCARGPIESFSVFYQVYDPGRP
jgi:hypothetical protein